jgi:hypothetical protein
MTCVIKHLVWGLRFIFNFLVISCKHNEVNTPINYVSIDNMNE